jgi:hypothetical protein
MRCKACNEILSDYELSRKDRDSGEFLDLCGRCLTTSNEAMLNYSTTTERTGEPIENILNK